MYVSFFDLLKIYFSDESRFMHGTPSRANNFVDENIIEENRPVVNNLGDIDIETGDNRPLINFLMKQKH